MPEHYEKAYTELTSNVSVADIHMYVKKTQLHLMGLTQNDFDFYEECLNRMYKTQLHAELDSNFEEKNSSKTVKIKL